jgi:maltose O-acetyltransferase
MINKASSLLARLFCSYKILFINYLSNSLGDDFLSNRIRGLLLKMLGMQLGKRTSVKGGSYFYGGNLRTGHSCHINRRCYFDFTDSVCFGDNVVIGHGTTFITAYHEIGGSERRAGKVVGKSIVLEDGVWIGANSTILPGVTVGAGAIVGANALVTKDVCANTMVAGIPATIIRKIDDVSSTVSSETLISRAQRFYK